MAEDKGLFWDKIGAALGALAVGLDLSGRGGRGGFGGLPQGAATGTGQKGFLVSLVEFGITLWRESGGSKEDEGKLGESLFADPSNRDTKLSPDERRKINAVLAAMTKSKRTFFKLVLYTLKPETRKIVTPEQRQKGADGKETVTPGSTREEPTGYHPRISVLKGIAEQVKDDCSNAADVAQMLDDATLLGSDNKALQFYKKAVEALHRQACEEFGVNDVNEITIEMVYAKIEKALDLGPKEPVHMNIMERFVNLFIWGSKDTPK